MEDYNMKINWNINPEQFNDKTFKHTHNDTIFLFKRSLQYIIDDYDEYLESVELSHYEDLGYYKITNYNSPQQSEILDLTWMRKEDVFDFEKSTQHQFIKQIDVNIDNLGFSHLPIGENMFNEVKLIVHNNDSKLSVINQIKNFKSFINEHSSALSRGIELEGFSPLIEIILCKYAEKRNIKVNSQNSYGIKSR